MDGEDAAASGAAHEFEATLGVLDLEARCGSHEEIEETAGSFASERLVFADQTAIDGAAADDDVRSGFRGGGAKLEIFFDGGGEVGVGEQDPIAGGSENPVTDGCAFTGIVWILEDFDGAVGVSGGEILEQANGCVARAIVDDEDIS